MGMAEIIAARKAREQGLSPVVKSDHGQVMDVTAKVIPEVAKIETPKPAEVKEVAATTPVKPMSFAEKVAEKRRLEAIKQNVAQLAEPAVAQTTSVPATAISPIADDEPPAKAGLNLPAIASAALKLSREERMKEILKGVPDNAKPEDAQAYADIKYRIDELVELSGEPLVGAMTELKKAMNKNPNATLLMLDQDIGQMVIALRAMTGTALAEASKPKTPGAKAGKPKNISLTAEQMEAAFNEL